jgi:hypothetical protein
MIFNLGFSKFYMSFFKIKESLLMQFLRFFMSRRMSWSVKHSCLIFYGLLRDDLKTIHTGLELQLLRLDFCEL